MRSLIQLAARGSVQPVRDEWARARDERPAVATSGGNWWTGGANGRPSVRAVYGIVICQVAAASVVNAFSGARDIPWRLGTPHNLWEPMLWSLTSGVVMVALLPSAALGFIFSALRAAMGPLRDLAYGLRVPGSRFKTATGIAARSHRRIRSAACVAVAGRFSGWLVVPSAHAHRQTGLALFRLGLVRLGRARHAPRVVFLLGFRNALERGLVSLFII